MQTERPSHKAPSRIAYEPPHKGGKHDHLLISGCGIPAP